MERRPTPLQLIRRSRSSSSSSSSSESKRVTAVYRNRPRPSGSSPVIAREGGGGGLLLLQQPGQTSPPTSCFIIPSLSFSSEGLSPRANPHSNSREILSLPSFDETDDDDDDECVRPERMTSLSMKTRKKSSKKWSVLASRFLSKLDHVDER